MPQRIPFERSFNLRGIYSIAQSGEKYKNLRKFFENFTIPYKQGAADKTSGTKQRAAALRRISMIPISRIGATLKTPSKMRSKMRRAA